MKVVCIDNYRGWANLTIGKIYDIVNINLNYYVIKNDVDYINTYDKTYFKLLSEYRNEKINKLLKE